MGNQESVSNDTYIVKKKITVKKKVNPINPINPPKEYKIEHNYEVKKEFNKEVNYTTNNSLIERSLLSDVYNKNNMNRVIDYPVNSNNQLSIPKTNIDNVQFSPYNFNEELDKFNKNIDTERVEFENSEKERRKLFELKQKQKSDYLEKQVELFETKYNPWEILELDYDDYNINNIKKAYKKKALKYHPDKAGPKYNDKFQLITQAYIYLLTKVEDKNIVDNKISVKVENIDYEDNINDNRENIYLDKDKFDINNFNKIFQDYKIPSSFDKGYGNLMKENIDNDNDKEIFGKKFNNDIFNAHFDNVKKTKNKNENMNIIEYREPDALDSSIGNLTHTFLGEDDVEDFGCVNSSQLSYTDIKKAHVDETLLIDVNKVKYKTYNSIDQLESDRSKISYTPTSEDKRRYDYLEQKRIQDDNFRMNKQRDYDELIKNQYDKLNRKLIIHK